jgi:hypothetical protein
MKLLRGFQLNLILGVIYQKQLLLFMNFIWSVLSCNTPTLYEAQILTLVKLYIKCRPQCDLHILYLSNYRQKLCLCVSEI